MIDLSMIEKQTPEICLAAVKEDKRALEYVRDAELKKSIKKSIKQQLEENIYD